MHCLGLYVAGAKELPTRGLTDRLVGTPTDWSVGFRVSHANRKETQWVK